MKKLLLTLTLLIFMSCSTFRLSTHNYDPIYGPSGEEIEVKVINSQWELNRELRNNFQFRYDIAQYALSQPRSFDWNNRLLGRRYNVYNSYYGFGYSNYWDRDQMWNDWVWGYPYGNGIGWSYGWSNNGWSNGFWGNSYGWNGYNNWGYGNSWYDPYNRRGYPANSWNNRTNYNNRRNVARMTGRRGAAITGTTGNTLVNLTPVSETRVDKITRELRNKDIKVRVINNPINNDQINRLNIRRNIVPTQINSNGGRSRSREITPIIPVRTTVPTTRQPRQIRRGPGSSSVQQPVSRNSSSQSRSSSTSRRKN